MRPLLIRYPINAPACDVKGYAGIISSIEFVFNQQQILSFSLVVIHPEEKPLQSSLIGCCCHRYMLCLQLLFFFFRSIITNQKIDINSSSSSWGGWSYNSQLLISDTGAAMFDVDAKEMKEKREKTTQLWKELLLCTLRAPG